MSKRTRQRELARLRARREAERRAAARRRALLLYGGLGVLVLVAGVAGGRALLNRQPAGAASATTAPATTQPKPAGNDARADAPTAPAQVACGAKTPPRHKHPKAKTAPKQRLDPSKTYDAVFKTSCGTFTVRLDVEHAPLTTANFVSLARKGFYDATWFHRIVPGGSAGIGVVQGGDPEGSGRGGPGYTIKDEKPKGKDPYRRYSVAMANSGQPNSGGSQFFISTQDNSKALPPSYAVFGEVTAGRKVVDQIAKVPVGGAQGDTPSQAVWIERLTVKVG
jgi:cyclophilin family peptidyl-prolyl cis-trans isomerase